MPKLKLNVEILPAEKCQRETDGIHILCFTGAAGNSKSTLVKLMEQALAPNGSGGRIVRTEMSDIIKWAIRQGGKLARLILKEKPRMDEGFLLSDPLTMRAFKKWFADKRKRNSRMKLLIVGGLPRSTMQLQVLVQLFLSVSVAHIRTTKRQSGNAIRRRLKQHQAEGREIRSDDKGGHKVINNRWKEHEECVIPMMAQLNGSGIHLSRRQLLRNRLKNAILGLLRQDVTPLETLKLHAALARIDDPAERVHQSILAVEAGKVI